MSEPLTAPAKVPSARKVGRAFPHASLEITAKLNLGARTRSNRLSPFIYPLVLAATNDVYASTIKRDEGSKRGRSLIPVNERVVLDQSVHQRCGLGGERVVVAVEGASQC